MKSSWKPSRASCHQRIERIISPVPDKEIRRIADSENSGVYGSIGLRATRGPTSLVAYTDFHAPSTIGVLNQSVGRVDPWPTILSGTKTVLNRQASWRCSASFSAGSDHAAFFAVIAGP